MGKGNQVDRRLKDSGKAGFKAGPTATRSDEQ